MSRSIFCLFVILNGVSVLSICLKKAKLPNIQMQRLAIFWESTDTSSTTMCAQTTNNVMKHLERSNSLHKII